MDLIHDARHLCPRLRTDGIKSDFTWFLKGGKFSNTRNQKQKQEKTQKQNEQLFYIETMIANYGWK